MIITYSQGYKYQLETDFLITISIKDNDIITPYIKLDHNGNLVIKKGYAWDGASGPAVDTKDFMRASLVHDALYQLMRECCLNRNYRSAADKIMKDICILDGMSLARAWVVYTGVRLFGRDGARPEGSYKIKTAP